MSIPRFTALGTTHAKIAAMKNLPERHAFHIIRFQIKEFIHLSVDEYKSTFVLRPMAGKKIMDVFLDEASRLSVRAVPNIAVDDYAKLEKMSMDFAYDAFLDLKDKQLRKNKESFEKYMYALKLRTEAAQQIGIENIRKSRIAKLQREKSTIEENYRKGQQVYPDFRLVALMKLEA